jgi:hypothetical protein
VKWPVFKFIKMLTPKQQILLDQLKERLPGMFTQFDLIVQKESPEMKKSREVFDRVQTITNQIMTMDVTPRTIHVEPSPLSYHQQVIQMYSGKYVHPPGAPCPF